MLDFQHSSTAGLFLFPFLVLLPVLCRDHNSENEDSQYESQRKAGEAEHQRQRKWRLLHHFLQQMILCRYYKLNNP
jgi:hypothetical protein